jgi:ATP-dependent DNA helicase RecG
MAIEISAVSADQRDKLVVLQEGHFIDAKAIEIGPAKLSRTVSAFANADGGELYIGLAGGSPPFRWSGFKDVEAANAHIQVFEQLFPLGTDFSYTFLGNDSESGLLLYVQVQKSKQIIKASDGTPYLRRGAQNLPVNTDAALKLLERNKGITSFENETVSTAVGEITNSETILSFILGVIPSAEPERWLRKQQLLVNDKPTVAGMVLFSDLPQALLPKRCGVKLYRYKTSSGEGTRDTLVGQPETIEGPLYDVIRAAVTRTKDLINELQRLGESGLEAISYPPETLHEVITNAVLHRDYAVADDVHIRVFDNRIEVESPGRLPAHITVSNILAERFARNGNIVRIINKFPNPPNKDIGEGLNTAFAAMRRLKLKEPVIEEREHTVVVHIKHEPLASAEEIVLDYLATHETITNAVGRQLTGIESENAMKPVFYRLRDRDLIEQVPELLGNKAAWRLAKKK